MRDDQPRSEVRIPQRPRNQFINGTRALTAPEHQQAQWLCCIDSVFGAFASDNLLANRIAGPLCPGSKMSDILKTGQHVFGKRSEKPVGDTTNRVGFVNHKGSAQQPGRNSSRACRKTAHAQHRIRHATTHDPERLDHRPQQHPGHNQFSHPGGAHQSLDLKPFHLESRDRNHARFKPSAGTQPHNFNTLIAEMFSHAQRGIHVPPGASCHDHHSGQRAPTRPFDRLCSMDINRPKASPLISMLLPP